MRASVFLEALRAIANVALPTTPTTGSLGEITKTLKTTVGTPVASVAADIAGVNSAVGQVQTTASIIQNIVGGSRQYGTVTIANGNTTGTAAIATLADTGQAYLFYLGKTAGATVTTQTDAQASITLTDASTVTATRVGTVGVVTVSFLVTGVES